MPSKIETRGRPYVVRYCACGGEALYVVQVLGRTVGKGQGRRTRKIKLGESIVICEQCARRFGETEHVCSLTDTTEEVLKIIRRQRVGLGPSLFEQV